MVLGGLTKGRNSVHEKLYDLHSVFCQCMYDHEFIVKQDIYIMIFFF